MKQWLLKEEEKAKVGRPKLANEDVIKKAKLSLCLSLFLCIVLSFFLASQITGEDPLKLAYSISLEKVFGALENKDGFIIKESYNKNNDYVMEVNIPTSVDNYSGSYKYTLYEMKNNSWKEKESKEIKEGTSSFKIVVKSLKNQNKTWKIKLQIVNGSKINKSYAPYGWSFVDANNNEDKYTYKIFTVKGYYSPVELSEIKEANNSNNKVTLSTKKNKPRSFILNLPDNNNFDVIVKYTDVNSKKVILANDKKASGTKVYNIPNLNRSTLVTFKIYSNNIKKLKLSNWKTNTDSNDNTYITNTYILKPEKAY